MSRENLRDYLPGADRNRDKEPPKQFYKSNKCELMNCACGGRGKADIVIQDYNKQPTGYVCCRGYYDHLFARGLTQMQTFKETGALLKPLQPTLNEQHGAHRFADIVSELDRYADSFHHQENDDA